MFIFRKFGFVLSLSLAAVFLNGCQTSQVDLDPSAIRWEKTIQQFAEQDREKLPPKDAMLLVGSSSFRMWKTAAEDFPEKTVINRGFGGSQMSDLLYYTDQLVLKYKPSEILVYEGDNDIASGDSPETIFREFKEFTRIVLSELPRANIYFVAIKPSPKREALMGEMDRANSMIAKYCAKKDRLQFIDIFTPMLDGNGPPRGELFIEDNLHMNAKGYGLWKDVVRRAMNFPEPLIPAE